MSSPSHKTLQRFVPLYHTCWKMSTSSLSASLTHKTQCHTSAKTFTCANTGSSPSYTTSRQTTSFITTSLLHHLPTLTSWTIHLSFFACRMFRLNCPPSPHPLTQTTTLMTLQILCLNPTNFPLKATHSCLH